MRRSYRAGFTIVELLIVVVVIAILATITIVSYNGIQRSAAESAIKSDLHNFAQKMELYNAENGAYPAILSADMGISFSRNMYGNDYQGYNLRYCINTDTNQYIIIANSKEGKYFRYTSDGGLESVAAAYGWSVCSQVGLVQKNPSYNGLNGSTWASWVN